MEKLCVSVAQTPTLINYEGVTRKSAVANWESFINNKHLMQLRNLALKSNSIGLTDIPAPPSGCWLAIKQHSGEHVPAIQQIPADYLNSDSSTPFST